MTRFVGLDVSQKITAICVVDDAGGRLWRGQCPTNPEQINILVRRHTRLFRFPERVLERTISRLWDAIGRLIDLFTPQECANFFA